MCAGQKNIQYREIYLTIYQYSYCMIFQCLSCCIFCTSWSHSIQCSHYVIGWKGVMELLWNLTQRFCYPVRNLQDSRWARLWWPFTGHYWSPYNRPKNKAFTLQQIRKISNGKPSNFQMNFPIRCKILHVFLLGFCGFLFFHPKNPTSDVSLSVSKRQAVWKTSQEKMCSCPVAVVERKLPKRRSWNRGKRRSGVDASPKTPPKSGKNPAFRAFQEKDQMESTFKDVRWYINIKVLSVNDSMMNLWRTQNVKLHSWNPCIFCFHR